MGLRIVAMSTRVRSFSSLFGSCGRPRSCNRFRGRIFVMDEVDDVELLVERVAALDLGKPFWRRVCGCRTHSGPVGDARAAQLRHDHRTAVGDVAWLRHWHVQRVVMDPPAPTGGRVLPLEAEGFDCWLVNAREVKNVPGRARRSGRCGLAGESGRAWHVPTVAGAATRNPSMRDLTRYRRLWCRSHPRAATVGSYLDAQSRSRRCCPTCTALPGGR